MRELLYFCLPTTVCRPVYQPGHIAEDYAYHRIALTVKEIVKRAGNNGEQQPCIASCRYGLAQTVAFSSLATSLPSMPVRAHSTVW